MAPHSEHPDQTGDPSSEVEITDELGDDALDQVAGGAKQGVTWGVV